MKVVFVNHIYLDSELSSTTQLAIVHQLRQLGIDAFLYVPSTSASTSQEYVRAIPMTTQSSLASAPLLNWKLLYILAKVLWAERPDVVMIDCLTFFGSVPYVALSKLGIIKTQFVFDVRSPPVSLVGIIGKLRDLEYSMSLRMSKYLIGNYTFLTEVMAAEQCSRAKIDIGRKKVGYWGCGVDTDLFDPIRYVEEAQRLRSRYGLQGKFVCLYHGVLAANRGLDNAIAALAEIASAYEDIVLFLLGDGPERSRLVEISKECRLEERVLIRGPVPLDQVPEYIQMADVCLIPLPDHSDWKGQQPLKLAEYLAMEKPILATNIPAHAVVVGESPAVTLLPDNNPHTLASALLDFYRKPPSIQGAREGRRLAKKTLSWNKIASDLVSYLADITPHSDAS